MKAKPLNELEMFELLRVAYPEKFTDETEETWEAAHGFAEELSGWDELADLLGRVAMLTMPMKSDLTKTISHCIGPVTIQDGNVRMTAVVRRDFC